MSKKKVLENMYGSKMNIIEARVRRFVALALDWYFSQVIVDLPFVFLLNKTKAFTPETFQLETYGISTGTMLGIYALIVGIIYYIIIPCYVWKGQTLGKKITGVRIVTENYEPVTLPILLKREIIGSTILEGGLIIIATYIRKFIALFGYTEIARYLKYLAWGITIASAIFAYVNKQSQSFHDKIAHTYVVLNKIVK